MDRLVTKEELKAIQDKWYSEERSPISLDNKRFMDLEEIASRLLEEREAVFQIATDLMAISGMVVDINKEALRLLQEKENK